MVKSEKEYIAIIKRIEELLSVPENIENPETMPPTLSEAIKMRIHER